MQDHRILIFHLAKNRPARRTPLRYLRRLAQ